ncbi:MAG: TlpA family protein disulfide reductase [Nitrospirae bacterium]|nr:TlpA family protein disulfide reductase [Nitrospirota bacterium]
MKTKAAIIILIFIAAMLVIQAGRHEGKRGFKRAVVGQEAPNFKFGAIDDKVITGTDYRGKVVIVHFWASWCTSCIGEMPSFQRFYESNKSNPSLEIITVLYKDSYDEAMKLMKKYKYSLPVYLDEKSANARAFGLTGVPETFFIDKQGILFKKILGPIEWESNAIKDLINELVSKS